MQKVYTHNHPLPPTHTHTHTHTHTLMVLEQFLATELTATREQIVNNFVRTLLIHSARLGIQILAILHYFCLPSFLPSFFLPFFLSFFFSQDKNLRNDHKTAGAIWEKHACRIKFYQGGVRKFSGRTKCNCKI